MPKELGQIHTVNHTMNVSASGALTNLDMSGQLSDQLSRNIRQGNAFKVVGIDCNMSTVGTLGGGQVTGYLRYYAPTKGRCAAYRNAFKATKNMFKTQGIEMDTSTYDFRCSFTDQNGGVVLPNHSTLDGSTGLALYHTTDAKASVFDVYNASVSPRLAIGSTVLPSSTGFDTIINEGATATDFVLNNANLYSGNPDYASLNWEYIPFTLTWTPDTTDMVTVWQWRPDPALYLSVMTGMFQIYIEEVNLDGGASTVELNFAFMTSGWSSIMSDKKKKSKGGRRRRTSKRRSRSKK